MSDTPLNAEDLAATLTGFAISLVTALKPKDPNIVLEKLATELEDLVSRAPGTPAAEAMVLTARFLKASEPDDE